MPHMSKYTSWYSHASSAPFSMQKNTYPPPPTSASQSLRKEGREGSLTVPTTGMKLRGRVTMASRISWPARQSSSVTEQVEWSPRHAPRSSIVLTNTGRRDSLR